MEKHLPHVEDGTLHYYHIICEDELPIESLIDVEDIIDIYSLGDERIRFVIKTRFGDGWRTGLGTINRYKEILV